MKYFITSDIHGFYDEFVDALSKTDFSRANPDHILIVCGDIFDRGTQPLEIYDFLREIPKERRVFIRGNHESLLKDLAERGYPLEHDYNNGTYDTLAYVAKQQTRQEFIAWQFEQLAKYKSYGEAEPVLNARLEKWTHKVFHNRKLKEILKWIDKEWVDYYEMDKYILIHSFIPTTLDSATGKEAYDPNWRNAGKDAWEKAKWGCPWKKLSLNQTGKTIICGHWHTSDFWNNLVYHALVYNTYTTNPIFYQPELPLIGLDACTAATGGVNILAIDDKELTLYNHIGEKKHVRL